MGRLLSASANTSLRTRPNSKQTHNFHHLHTQETQTHLFPKFGCITACETYTWRSHSPPDPHSRSIFYPQPPTPRLAAEIWETERQGHSSPWIFCPQNTEAPGSKECLRHRLGPYTEPKSKHGVFKAGLETEARRGRSWSLLTQGVPHGDNRALAQLRVPTLIRQNHCQVWPPVSPLLVPTALKSSRKMQHWLSNTVPARA